MKKALNIVKKILVTLVFLVAVAMMVFTIVSVTTFDRTDRNLFGYKAFIVLSDSMSKTDFKAGDLILVKEVDPSTLQAGDIISYESTNTDNYGEVVTHKIRSLTTDENGQPGFITYGTTTDTDDQNVVTYPYVLGKYQRRFVNVGSFFQFLKTTPGYYVCIFLPFMLLIVVQAINSVKLFRQYKAEQLEEVQAERDQLKAEREASQKMMEELVALRKELGLKDKAPEPAEAPAEAPQTAPEAPKAPTEPTIDEILGDEPQSKQ